MALSFYEGLPKVSAEDNAELEAPLSAQELQEALQSMQSGKAPGKDVFLQTFTRLSSLLWAKICSLFSERV